MMFWLFNDDKKWFRARAFGFGAGIPFAWQGWALLGLHVALILGVTSLLRDKPLALILTVIAIGLAPLPIYAAQTEGGMRWRWGRGK